MHRSTHFHRWGPIGLGTLLMAACPGSGDVASATEPGTSSGGSDSPTSGGPESATDTPTTDTPTTGAPGTTAAPTTGDSSTTGTVDPSGGESGSTSTTDTTGAGSGSGSGTDGTTGTTGDPVQPGASVSMSVSAGKTTSSAKFRMVFTFGQPTQHQGTHLAKQFRLRGGLIGANGDTP